MTRARKSTLYLIYVRCGPPLAFEAEYYIENLETLTVEEIGSKKFLDQHEKIEKLQAVAHYQAEDKTDEYVVDLLNTYDKVGTVIQNLVVIEAWKEHVFPLVQDKICSMSSIRNYIPLYHEASCIGLLEMALYNSTSADTAGDVEDPMNYSI